jgi:hypothetical protein
MPHAARTVLPTSSPQLQALWVGVNIVDLSPTGDGVQLAGKITDKQPPLSS